MVSVPSRTSIFHIILAVVMGPNLESDTEAYLRMRYN